MNPREAFHQVAVAMNVAFIGQESVVKQLPIAFLTDGHNLMEGLFGTARSRAFKPLDKLIARELRRVQLSHRTH
jgi:MoxR-like ATPase